MNILYHHPTYIGAQKIQYLPQNFIIIFIIFSLCHFYQVMIRIFISV